MSATPTVCRECGLSGLERWEDICGDEDDEISCMTCVPSGRLFASRPPRPGLSNRRLLNEVFEVGKTKDVSSFVVDSFEQICCQPKLHCMSASRHVCSGQVSEGERWLARRHNAQCMHGQMYAHMCAPRVARSAFASPRRAVVRSQQALRACTHVCNYERLVGGHYGSAFS